MDRSNMQRASTAFLLSVGILALLLPSTLGQMLCNLCNSNAGCCSVVVSDSSSKVSCTLDDPLGMKFLPDDGYGGMSIMFTRQGDVCMQAPLIGNVTYPSGGYAENYVKMEVNPPWGDAFYLYALTSGGYTVCWTSYCCVIKGSSGKCRVAPDRTIHLYGVGLGTSDCRYGELSMSDDEGHLALGCLDRRPAAGSDYMMYWSDHKCSGISGDRLSATCKAWVDTM